MTRVFRKISEIRPESPESYEGALFLTFDIDWACDDVLADAIDLVEEAGAAATWFVTHDTPLLKRLRENPKFELGIHPNFNPLLGGDFCNGQNAYEVIERVKLLVPDATAVRSHSLAFGSLIQEKLNMFAITHDCNLFIPHQENAFDVYPAKLWDGLIRIPYLFCDYVSALYGFHDLDRILNRKGLKVFDFHPIHVFLNTERMERYEESRPYHRSPEDLLKYRNNETPGARTALKTLLELK